MSNDNNQLSAVLNVDHSLLLVDLNYYEGKETSEYSI